MPVYLIDFTDIIRRAPVILSMARADTIHATAPGRDQGCNGSVVLHIDDELKLCKNKLECYVVSENFRIGLEHRFFLWTEILCPDFEAIKRVAAHLLIGIIGSECQQVHMSS